MTLFLQADARYAILRSEEFSVLCGRVATFVLDGTHRLGALSAIPPFARRAREEGWMPEDITQSLRTAGCAPDIDPLPRAERYAEVLDSLLYEYYHSDT